MATASSLQYNLNLNSAYNAHLKQYSNGTTTSTSLNSTLQADANETPALNRSNSIEYVSSLNSASYCRESTPSTGNSIHFMDGYYRDFNGNSPHSSYAMFAAQSEYPPPPNSYAGYNPAYHYSNPYINPASTNGYPLSVTGEYNPNAPFGMAPPQHLPQDIKIPKDR